MSLMDKFRAVFEEDKTIFDRYTANLLKLRQRLLGLKNLRLVGKEFLYSDKNGHSCGIEYSKTIADYDISKLVIHTGTNFNGKVLAQILLKEYNIQIELAEAEYIIAMTSVADTVESLDALATALEKIDKTLPPYLCAVTESELPLFAVPEVSPRTAFYADKELVSFDAAVGRLCGECITPFPPDIPMLAVGERITGEHIEKIRLYLNMGITLIGVDEEKIKILS
jgi:arginine/lysine/ornithine decarboxylase